MKTPTELIKAIQSGDQAAFSELLARYQPMLTAAVQSFSTTCPTLDREDLFQEASLALSDAAKSFDLCKSGVTFGLYGKICVRNRLISLQRKERARLKKSPKIEQAVEKKSLLPKTLSLEECRALLSPFENRVLTLYADDLSYSEIAKELGCSVKSVDNALYRIKKKIRPKM